MVTEKNRCETYLSRVQNDGRKIIIFCCGKMMHFLVDTLEVHLEKENNF